MAQLQDMEVSSSHNIDPRSTRSLSSEARAQLILNADNITFDTKLHVFNVKGLSGHTRVVSLFPKLRCSCPSMNDCYHIIAAKRCIGMPTSSRKRSQLSLSQLRRNTRSRKEKRGGRKRPRPNDVAGEGKCHIDCGYLQSLDMHSYSI